MTPEALKQEIELNASGLQTYFKIGAIEIFITPHPDRRDIQDSIAVLQTLLEVLPR